MPSTSFRPSPQPRHTGMVQAGCVQATGTTKQPSKETQFLATQRAISTHIPPKPQQVNHMAVLARRISRGRVRWKEESHDSGGGFIKPPVQRISKELVNYCS